MNTLLPAAQAARLATVRPILVPVARPVHRERDFGVGYGRSSGYATARRYASQWAPSRFRIV